MTKIKDFDKKTTCFFCGHWVMSMDERHAVIHMLLNEIEIAVKEGFRTFLCDAMPGFSTAAAQGVLYCKQTSLLPLKLVIVLPRRSQSWEWPACDRQRHEAVLARADQIIRSPWQSGVFGAHAAGKWMADHSSKCILCMEEKRKESSTYQTFLYALQQKVDVSVNLYDQLMLEVENYWALRP